MIAGTPTPRKEVADAGEVQLAVDTSEHARKAVPAAIELARVGGGTVGAPGPMGP
jgi:hypothetical protein